MILSIIGSFVLRASASLELRSLLPSLDHAGAHCCRGSGLNDVSKSTTSTGYGVESLGINLIRRLVYEQYRPASFNVGFASVANLASACLSSFGILVREMACAWPHVSVSKSALPLGWMGRAA